MTRLALIAHDDQKAEMVDLAKTYGSALSAFDLVGAGTTGKRVAEETGLDVERERSGPQGGDAQTAAEVTEDRLDGLVADRDG